MTEPTQGLFSQSWPMRTKAWVLSKLPNTQREPHPDSTWHAHPRSPSSVSGDSGNGESTMEFKISTENIQAKENYFIKLPDELQLAIFDFLDDQSLDLASQVCRSWRVLAGDNTLWKSLYFSHPGWEYDFDPRLDSQCSLNDKSPPSPAETLLSATLARDTDGLRSLDLNESFTESTTSSFTTPLSSMTTLKDERVSMEFLVDWRRAFNERNILERRWQKKAAQCTILSGHRDGVYCLQFDKKRIVSGSRDRTIRVWDAETGECTQVLEGHEGSVISLQYDDKIMVSGSSDCRVLVWDIQQVPWKVTNTLLGHTMGVLDICFDDKWIVSCSKDTSIRVWRRDTGELHRVITSHSGPVNAIELKNGHIASASGDSTMMLWDLESPKTEFVKMFRGHTRGIACLAWSESGKYLVTGSNDRTIKIWEVGTGTCRTLVDHTHLVRSVAIDERRNMIVSCSYDRSVIVWDLETEKTLFKHKSPPGNLLFDVAFDCQKILSCGRDTTIRILDFGKGLDCTRFV